MDSAPRPNPGPTIPGPTNPGLRLAEPGPGIATSALAVLAVIYLLGPVIALGIKVPWAQLAQLALSPDTLILLKVTLLAALASTAGALVLGVPLALWLNHARRGKTVVRLIVLLPLAMPPVVSGLALTAAVGRLGVAGPLLDAAGVALSFTFPGVVIAHIFVTLPFVVVTVDSALRQLDGEVGASARAVGVTRTQVLTHITLPTIAPAIATGAGLAFARSLGEFGTTLTFAGSMPGTTRTMSLGIYLAREVSIDAAYALSALLIGLAVACLVLASLPALLTRTPRPVIITPGPMDYARLRELTAPASRAPAGALTVTVAGKTTTFNPGGISAVIGPNGSGKSTLLGIISGRVYAPGAEVDTHGAQVRLLPQRPALPPKSTVRGCITMVTHDSARADAMLAAAGLEALADIRVPALSGGQAAQVALVRALASRPEVLLLDEPLAALDVTSAARWRRLLNECATDRLTVIVTHDITDILELARDTVVLDTGKVISCGPTREVLEVPPSPFVSKIAGLNLLTGTITAVGRDTIALDCGGVMIHGSFHPATRHPAGGSVVGENATVVALPESTTVHRARTFTHAHGGAGTGGMHDPQVTVWAGTVRAVKAQSLARALVLVDVGGSLIEVPLTRKDALSMSLAPGTPVALSTPVADVSVFLNNSPAAAPAGQRHGDIKRQDRGRRAHTRQDETR